MSNADIQEAFLMIATSPYVLYIGGRMLRSGLRMARKRVRRRIFRYYGKKLSSIIVGMLLVALALYNFHTGIFIFPWQQFLKK